ncbi:Beta,beta-carotene 15,15'-dioxygenase [Lachnellula suecica]|uniref:Beta,beta-carotene 15,15'-dioxygenase n=1 Tax=Lachnellula suecica TaxID=602035 RepID=A0A8T9C791_9HELO|nr:Beta,beta-carotene 15,15'-dioxygenase [Lachnellula suecica]
MATLTLQNNIASGFHHEKQMETTTNTESIRDWPNEAGQFQTLHEERKPVEVRTTGSIPAYAAGTLYRTGPASYKVDRGEKGEYKCSHWFDGFGHTHRFEIVAGDDGKTKVLYNSRRANDELIESIKDKGKYGYVTYGQKKDPCIGLFGKVMSYFTPPTDPGVVNVAVTVHPNMPGLPSSASGHKGKAKSLWTASDNSKFKELDPLTLEPIGIASQKTLHPLLKGPMSCAHAQTDPKTGDMFNYNLDLGRVATYRVFKTSAATGKTEILATISGFGVKPAYLHSFFLTEDFVVLCIWGAHMEGTGLKIITEQSIVDALSPFDARKPTKWFVVDRKNGKGLVAEFESPAAFCFHTVNAWQEERDGKMDIVGDFSEYGNLDIIHSLYYTNLTSEGENAVTFRDKSGESSMPNMVRYRLRDIGKTTISRNRGRTIPKAEKIISIPKRQGGELPTMNPNYTTRPSRYIYSVVNRGLSTFMDCLSKVDMESKEVLFWDNPKGHTPGEAIFVPDPEGTDEDSGVLLSVVLDGFRETSYLVCLDAKTMEELGRAECEWAVGFGFHGKHL